MSLPSITYGMAAIAMHKGNKSQVISWLALTFLFGAGFIGMEIYEFHHLIAEGMGPNRSGFLSAFFSLVGTRTHRSIPHQGSARRGSGT